MSERGGSQLMITTCFAAWAGQHAPCWSALPLYLMLQQSTPRQVNPTTHRLGQSTTDSRVSISRPTLSWLNINNNRPAPNRRLVDSLDSRHLNCHQSGLSHGGNSFRQILFLSVRATWQLKVFGNGPATGRGLARGLKHNHLAFHIC